VGVDVRRAGVEDVSAGEAGVVTDDAAVAGGEDGHGEDGEGSVRATLL
jgi:hypothetical protein